MLLKNVFRKSVLGSLAALTLMSNASDANASMAQDHQMGSHHSTLSTSNDYDALSPQERMEAIEQRIETIAQRHQQLEDHFDNIGWGNLPEEEWREWRNLDIQLDYYNRLKNVVSFQIENPVRAEQLLNHGNQEFLSQYTNGISDIAELLSQREWNDDAHQRMEYIINYEINQTESLSQRAFYLSFDPDRNMWLSQGRFFSNLNDLNYRLIAENAELGDDALPLDRSLATPYSNFISGSTRTVNVNNLILNHRAGYAQLAETTPDQPDYNGYAVGLRQDYLEHNERSGGDDILRHINPAFFHVFIATHEFGHLLMPSNIQPAVQSTLIQHPDEQVFDGEIRSDLFAALVIMKYHDDHDFNREQLGIWQHMMSYINVGGDNLDRGITAHNPMITHNTAQTIGYVLDHYDALHYMLADMDTIEEIYQFGMALRAKMDFNDPYEIHRSYMDAISFAIEGAPIDQVDASRQEFHETIGRYFEAYRVLRGQDHPEQARYEQAIRGLHNSEAVRSYQHSQRSIAPAIDG